MEGVLTGLELKCRKFNSAITGFFFNRPDLLKIEPHTAATEPVKYDKKDGQWYTHNGVDVQDTQQRKGTSKSVVTFLAGFQFIPAVTSKSSPEFNSLATLVKKPTGLPPSIWDS